MSEASFSIELNSCKVYLFKDKQSTLIEGLQWRVRLNQEGKLVIVNEEREIVFARELIRIKYKDVQVLYSVSVEGFYAIHLPLQNQQNELIQFRMQENMLKISEWDKTDKEIKKLIMKNCGDKIDKFQNIDQRDKINSFSFKIGGVFGALNNFFVSPNNKLQKAFQDKVHDIKEEKFSEETKSNWKTIKTRAKELNHSAAEAILPVRTKVAGLTSKLGTKFDNSQNFIIKEFGYSLRNSLNEGYKNYNKSSAEAPPAHAQQPLKPSDAALESDRQLK